MQQPQPQSRHDGDGSANEQSAMPRFHDNASAPIQHPCHLYSSPPQPHLPPGWVEAIDPLTGKLYYGNSSTGQSSWQPPVLPPPPPPPPPPRSTLVQQQAPVWATQINGRTAPQSLTNEKTGVGEIVSQVRALIDTDWTLDRGGEEGALELPELSAGALADLCHMQEEFREVGNGVEGSGAAKAPYEPLEPHALRSTARRPHIEPGRVEIRMMALYDKLRQLGNAT